MTPSSKQEHQAQAAQSSSPLAQQDSANNEFKRSYSSFVAIGVILAVGIHFTVFQLVPQFQAADMGTAAAQMEAVELPPQVEIPPPPKQVSRPATPKVAEADISEDVTISKTTLEANPVEKLPPPPKAGQGSKKDRPSFIPRDVDPQLQNQAEVQQLLKRFYPPTLREAGIGSTLLVWLYVNKEGRVEKIQLKEPSDYEAFNAAARKVAKQMSFKPAINRDKPIGVWVQQRISFRVQQ